MPRSDNLSNEAISNNVTPPYAAIVYRYGALYYAESLLGERLINPRTEAGVVIKAAASWVGDNGGGFVHIKAGTYSVSTQIVQPSNVMFIGEGRSNTLLVSAASLASTQIVNSDINNGNSYMGLAYLTVNHSAASAGTSVNYTRVDDSIWLYCRFIANSASFSAFWTGSTDTADRNIVLGNIFDGNNVNGGDVFGGGKLTDSVVAFNQVINCSSTGGGIVQRVPLRTLFVGNSATGCNNGGISLETGKYCMCIGNDMHDNNGPGIAAGTSADGDPIENIFIGNVCKDNANAGLSLAGTGNVVNDNFCSGNDSAGINITGNNCVVTGNVCKNNGQDSNLLDSFKCGIRLTSVTDCIVTSNRCFDDQGSQTQLKGINEVGSSDYNVICVNSVRGNATANISYVGTNSIIENNIGYTKPVDTSSGETIIPYGAPLTGAVINDLGVRTGISSQYTFAGNFNDSVGANNLTANGAPTYADGVYGQAVVLNGSTQYGNAAANTVFDMTTNDFSICAWIKRTSASGNTEYIASKRAANAAGYSLALNSAGRVFAEIRASALITTTSTSVLDVGIWYHVAVSFDRDANCTIYINGVADGTAQAISAESASITNTETFTTGRRSAASDGFLTATMDDLRIYGTTAISAAQALRIAGEIAQGQIVFCSSTGSGFTAGTHYKIPLENTGAIAAGV